MGAPKHEHKSTPRSLAVFAAILAVGTLIRIPQLGHHLYEAYAFRQTQTAFVIREYSRQGIDLLTTPLPVFGADADVPFEFPLFQGVAAILTRLGMSPEMAGRTVGLIAFQVTVGLTWVLVRRWHSDVAANLTAGLMQFLPFGLAWGAACLIDFSAVALSLGMVVALDGYLRQGSPRLLLVGAVCAWLAMLVKVTTPVPWCILLAFAALALPRSRSLIHRSLVAAALGPGVGVVAATVWTRYADSVKAANPTTSFIMSDQLTAWNFGTLEGRLSASDNLVLGHHALLELGAPLGLAVLAALFGALSGSGNRWHRTGLLACFLSGPLIFFNLYVVHAYYWIAVFPAAAALMAVGLVAARERFARVLPRETPAVAMMAATLVLVAAVVPVGLQQVAQFARQNTAPQLVVAAANFSQPDDQLLVLGCDWDPTLLYGADRQGFMIRDLSNDAAPPSDLMPLYQHLVTCGDSIDPEDYLPPGWRAVPTGQSMLYTVERDGVGAVG